MISWHDFYTVLTAVVPLYMAMILAYGSVRCWKIFSPDQCSGINRFVAIFAVPLFSSSSYEVEFMCNFGKDPNRRLREPPCTNFYLNGCFMHCHGLANVKVGADDVIAIELRCKLDKLGLEL
ncbi:hypothetical protein C1H46_032925 [Malus baccata]|uniref:Uncharacterized protein n=1 Tax=Malus baccata TaxID=106549 RepID=A0A540L4X2_MALBA|nr:hypothetical protein C1H46_032925 [Malus baccata]